MKRGSFCSLPIDKRNCWVVLYQFWLGLPTPSVGPLPESICPGSFVHARARSCFVLNRCDILAAHTPFCIHPDTLSSLGHKRVLTLFVEVYNSSRVGVVCHLLSVRSIYFILFYFLTLWARGLKFLMVIWQARFSSIIKLGPPEPLQPPYHLPKHVW